MLKKSSIQFIIALVTMSISPLIFSQTSRENSENWHVTSAWVKEVTPEQQLHAIFSAFAALRKKTDELIQYRQDHEQVLWVSKTIACGTSMLAKISTKNPVVQSQLQEISDLYVRLIRGEISGEQFSDREQKVRRDLILAFSKIQLKSYEDSTIVFKKRLLDTNTSLVVNAMECHANKEKSHR
jgi:hypothetical protein